MQQIILISIIVFLNSLAFAQIKNSSQAPSLRTLLRQAVPQEQSDKLLGYLNKYKNNLGNTRFATFIDFGRPSTEKRMFLIDLQSGEIKKYFVAHGKGSGLLYANKFSNKGGSHQSSLGLYVVQGSYWGKHGASLYLDGLEKSNSNARIRNIVIHAAKYVSNKFINTMGYLGRSQGCPALNPEDLKDVLPKIKGGSLLLAFE